MEKEKIKKALLLNLPCFALGIFLNWFWYLSRTLTNKDVFKVIDLILKNPTILFRAIAFKGSELTTSLLQQVLKKWIESTKVTTFISDPKGRIDLFRLGDIGGKTSNIGTELNSVELKILESEFKKAGVKRWSAEKIGDTCLMSFPNTKANEVEVAMKLYLSKSLEDQASKGEKFSLRSLSTLFKDKMEKYNEGREATDKHKSQERSL